MKILHSAPGFIIAILWMGFIFPLRAQQEKSYKILSIAFYNVENLFDTEDDPNTFDDDRTPTGKDLWTPEKYQEKLKHIARVISEIGKETAGASPAIIGLCEIENYKVLEDLINQPGLSDQDYGIVHFDSPDSRGVDVALLYRKSLFEVLDSQPRKLLLYDPETNKRVYTRDQLVVTGMLDGGKISFIINHWPSRSGGETLSKSKRVKAAELNKRIIDSLFKKEPGARIISMGDFNDDPFNYSIKKVLQTRSEKKGTGIQEFYNPMEKLLKSGMGTLAYRDNWNLFDQILISGSLLNSDYIEYGFYKAGIFNKSYLLTPDGQYAGYPFRSYGYGGYQGGYSDHLPVYCFLIKEIPPAAD